MDNRCVLDVSGGLHTLNMLFKSAEPLVERLLGIDDNLKLAIGEFADYARSFRGEGNLHPFTIEAQSICQVKNPADLLKRNRVERHAYLSLLSGVRAF